MNEIVNHEEAEELALLKMEESNLARCYLDMKRQLDELRKEAQFRIEAADLWVSQLREALAEAMDALASDPEHDVLLQARLEIARRGVVIEQRTGEA